MATYTKEQTDHFAEVDFEHPDEFA